MLILYFVPDLNDPAVRRRVSMFQMGGAGVRLVGFHRKAAATRIEGVDPVDLGLTSDGRLAARVFSTLRATARASQLRSCVVGADVIVARNLEMLAIAVSTLGLTRSIPLIYESLDIHRMMLGRRPASRLLRQIEGLLSRRASLLLTSSPAFIENYFGPVSLVDLPVLVVENKVFLGNNHKDNFRLHNNSVRPWRIGWFGAIRCSKSFAILSRLTRALNGRVEVIIRGRPTASVFPDFEALIAREPFIQFGGPYNNPEDLAEIYSGVDYAWAIDYFEEGQNSEWLLPNRLYESGWGGAIPMALRHTATGRWLAERNVGVTLSDPVQAELESYFNELLVPVVEAQRQRIKQLPATTWLCTPEECKSLVSTLVNRPHCETPSR